MWRPGRSRPTRGRTGTGKFAAMIIHILGQQAAAIGGYLVYDRIATAVGGIPTPRDVLHLGVGQLDDCLPEAEALAALGPRRRPLAPGVLPAADAGLRGAIRHALGFGSMPTALELRGRAWAWSP
jgi:hypothetical protein